MPRILITNDDGITAPGLKKLFELANPLGECLVVAPDKPQSCMGHAITIDSPLRLRPSPLFGSQSHECTGTPADCVKVAVSHLFIEEPPDLILSGINHGSNASINVLYSGTMSAASEGALSGFPAIGFSFCEYSRAASMDHVDEVVQELIAWVLDKGLPRGVALNVNLPPSEAPLLGFRFCRQANAHWQEQITPKIDPHGREYLWMSGDLAHTEAHRTHVEDDLRALEEGYASVVPCQYDLTAHDLVAKWRNSKEISSSDALRGK